MMNQTHACPFCQRLQGRCDCPRLARGAVAAASLAVLTACGGGGSPATPAEDQQPRLQAPGLGPAMTIPISPAPAAPVQSPVILPPPSPAPAPAPTPAPTAPPITVSQAPAGDGRWPQAEAPVNPMPEGTDPPPSGKSLNWWGTPPTTLFDVNNSCTPQPACRIPDGDLAIWNRQCPPVGDPYRAQCYVPLSFEPQVRPEPRGPIGSPPPGTTRPDPLTATPQEIDEWNRYCLTPQCLVTPGVLP